VALCEKIKLQSKKKGSQSMKFICPSPFGSPAINVIVPISVVSLDWVWVIIAVLVAGVAPG